MKNEKTPLQYRLKAVKSGKTFEWYEFEQSVKLCPSDKKRRVSSKSDLEKFAIQNLRRSRQELTRIVQCNGHLNKFLTLTFADDNMTDISITNKIFENFVKRLGRKYQDFQYICVPELQFKRQIKFNLPKAPVHYHLLCKLPYIRVKQIEKIWGQGFIWINRIDKISVLGSYIAKYLTKDNITHFYRKKKFFTSSNLKRPTVLYDDYALRYQCSLKLQERYSTTFDSPFTGTVLYRAYDVLDK